MNDWLLVQSRSRLRKRGIEIIVDMPTAAFGHLLWKCCDERGQFFVDQNGNNLVTDDFRFQSASEFVVQHGTAESAVTTTCGLLLDVIFCLDSGVYLQGRPAFNNDSYVDYLACQFQRTYYPPLPDVSEARISVDTRQLLAA